VSAEDPGEAERPAPARVADCRPDRAALADPAVVEGDLLAELADIDELVGAVGREPVRPLTEQQGALAHGAAVHLHDPHGPHEDATIWQLQGFSGG